MSRCVPNWDLDDDDTRPRHSLLGPELPSVDSDVAELTWENGQLYLHGLGQSRLSSKPSPASGTLESLMNQAAPDSNQAVPMAGFKPSYASGPYLVPWFNPSHAPTDVVTAASVPMMMDALVPCAADDPRRQAMWLPADSAAHGTGSCGCSSAHVGSCSAMGIGDGLLHPAEEQQRQGSTKRIRYNRGPREWGDHLSMTGNATSHHRATTLDAYERERELENAVSEGSPEYSASTNGSGERVAAATTEEHDSVHCWPRREDELKRRIGKSSLLTKRSRAAASHNQSERKRRDKINQRMKTLQKLVPNSSKTDKASVLDEVIDYLKQLQAQVQQMSRTSTMPLLPMMLPVALQQQQQLQLSMMNAPLGLGPGLAGMPSIMAGDMSSLGFASLPNIPGIPAMPVIPPYPFMPMASWDGTPGARFPRVPMTPDPLPTGLAGQSMPNYDLQAMAMAMAMDAYSRLAAIHQHQQPSNPNT